MQFALEVIMEVLGEVIWGAIASGFDGRRPTTASHHVARLFGFFCIGLTAGWISVELYPTHVLSNVTVRHAWLA